MEQPPQRHELIAETRAREIAPQLPISVSDQAVMRAFGVENIAIFILDGLTNREIAARLGVSPYAIQAYIHNLHDNDRELIDAALKASAERLYDIAGEILDAPLGEGQELTSAQVALRVARAQHRRQQAGIRSAKYRDKGAPAEHAPPPAPPSFHFRLEIAEPRPTLQAQRIED